MKKYSFLIIGIMMTILDILIISMCKSHEVLNKFIEKPEYITIYALLIILTIMNYVFHGIALKHYK